MNFLMQLSKSLPSGLVDFDDKWPSTCSLAFQDANQCLKEMYRLHLARTFMRKLTPEDRAQVGVSVV